jgi:hypothetical protein
VRVAKLLCFSQSRLGGQTLVELYRSWSAPCAVGTFGLVRPQQERLRGIARCSVAWLASAWPIAEGSYPKQENMTGEAIR